MCNARADTGTDTLVLSAKCLGGWEGAIRLVRPAQRFSGDSRGPFSCLRRSLPG